MLNRGISDDAANPVTILWAPGIRAARSPRVSIGLPVFNGEKYLAESIESILAQTFKDLELIISDNASQDQTEAICRKYAAMDGRIRYERQETNRGAAWNHNHVFHLASGDYFKWQCHDDICDRTFIERCVVVMDREAPVVLCYSQFARVDEHSRLLLRPEGEWNSIGSSAVTGIARPHKRFHALLHRRDACEEIYGLMRTSIAKQTRLIGPYTQADDNFLAELALRGRFHEIPEPLFFYRLHPENSTKTYQSRLQRMAWFDPEAAGRFNMPYVRQFREYVLLIARSRLPFGEQACCYMHTLGWAWKFRGWLREDIHESLFVGSIVPFLKRRVPWSRDIWRFIKKFFK